MHVHQQDSLARRCDRSTRKGKDKEEAHEEEDERIAEIAELSCECI